MEEINIGAGLMSIAFWGFLAAVVVGGMWYSIREKEVQQETLRRLIESGQPIDETLADRFMAINRGNDHLDRDLRVGGMICLPISIGLAVFGVILGTQYEEALMPLVGVGVLLAFVSIGLLVAARVASPPRQQSD
jgi:hypothetical protein